MKRQRLLKYALALLVTAGALGSLRGADTPAAPEKRPTREEWQKLTPEERQVKIKEWQEKRKAITDEQREAQRKVWRERMEKTIEELKKKKADGTIAPDEQKKLERMEQMMKKWAELSEKQPSDKAPEKPSPKPDEKK